MSESLEDQIVSIGPALEDMEKHAKAVLSRIKAMRKRTARGDISAVKRGLQNELDRIAQTHPGCRLTLWFEDG